jgi:hypothetical protein
VKPLISHQIQTVLITSLLLLLSKKTATNIKSHGQLDSLLQTPDKKDPELFSLITLKTLHSISIRIFHTITIYSKMLNITLEKKFSSCHTPVIKIWSENYKKEPPVTITMENVYTLT